jgi:2'-5' RNA ligase
MHGHTGLLVSETPGTLRCFAACFVDATSATTLLARVPRIPGMRAVTPNKLHVTLRFFGALDSAEVNQARGLIGGLSAPEPRVVRIVGLTGFSSPRRATALVVTLENDTQLLRWHSELAAHRGRSEDSYRPHVTVARSPRDIDVSPLLARPVVLETYQILLRAPGLYASESSPEGSRYRFIE